MRIVFFGTPEIAAEILEDLIKEGFDIPLVVTKPDRPKGRSDRPQPCPVKECALAHAIELIQPERASTPEWIEKIRSVKPDLFVVVAYGEIIKQALLDVPKYGAINLHASLLPKYRGAAPIQRALMEGEKESGVSIIRLVQKMDAGPVLVARPIQIPDEMRSKELFESLRLLGRDALIEAIRQIDRGTAVEVAQNEGLATYAPKLELEECELKFDRSAQELHNLVRGAYPNPGAWMNIRVDGELKRVKVLKTRVRGDLQAEPGRLIESKREFLVGANRGVLEILELKMEGKPQTEAGKWLNGYYGHFIIE